MPQVANTLKIAIVSCPATSIVMEKIAHATNPNQSEMFNAMITDITESLRLSTEDHEWIDGKLVTDPQVQEVLVRSDRWPGLSKHWSMNHRASGSVVVD